LPAWRSRLETADEIPDPDDVALSISANGELKQSSSSSKQLIYDCRKLIEWGSSFYTFSRRLALYRHAGRG
jgi:2-keto-4-pentenoate hydratase/2-oxohepta-3-ene-1,7-dioic acid hydratase in catechol pathway